MSGEVETTFLRVCQQIRIMWRMQHHTTYCLSTDKIGFSGFPVPCDLQFVCFEQLFPETLLHSNACTLVYSILQNTLISSTGINVNSLLTSSTSDTVKQFLYFGGSNCIQHLFYLSYVCFLLFLATNLTEYLGIYRWSKLSLNPCGNIEYTMLEGMHKDH